MNRIDRISAILIQLQSRKVVKAQDIAKRFGISLRTVYRDIRTLEEAGIPLIGEAGVGYSIMDGYRLPPVMFTLEEATAFITAEKLVEKLTDAANSDHYQSAMYKVKAVLRNSEKDLITNMDDRIAVLKARRPPPHIKQEVNPIQIILKAISERKRLELHYFSYHRNEFTNRCIEPVGIFYLDNYWHLIAWCRMRKDYRDFRFDRIADLVITEETFKDQHPPLENFLGKMFHDQHLTQITVSVDMFASKHLGEQKYYHGFTGEKEVDGRLEMSFLSGSLEGFARWYMMFADQSRIIEPNELKERIRELNQQISLNL